MTRSRSQDGLDQNGLSYVKNASYAVKLLHSICQQIWKTQQWPQDWKRSVFIPIPKKGNAKECSNYRTIALILHASPIAGSTPGFPVLFCLLEFAQAPVH